MPLLDLLCIVELVADPNAIIRDSGRDFLIHRLVQVPLDWADIFLFPLQEGSSETSVRRTETRRVRVVEGGFWFLLHNINSWCDFVILQSIC